MSDRSWWSYALQWGLWFVVMSLVMGWLARSRLKKRPAEETNVLSYPLSVLVIGLVCSGVFIAFAVLSAFFPNETGSPLITALFLGFTALGVYLILEYVRVHHRLEPEGLRFQTLFSGSGFLEWKDVVRVRYSELSRWFIIDGPDGELIRVSCLLRSLPEFADAVLQTVPPERIDQKALDMLEQTAAGSPPSIWG